MSEQKVDTDQLRALTEALAELVTYTELLRDGAGGFAYMLPAEWQGPAMSRFLSSFELWAVSAEGLRSQTEALEQLASAALSAYEKTIEGLDESWSGIRSGLGA